MLRCNKIGLLISVALGVEWVYPLRCGYETHNNARNIQAVRSSSRFSLCLAIF